MNEFLKRFWCRLTFHNLGGVQMLGSWCGTKGGNGLIAYRCKRCGDCFAEKDRW